MHTCTHIHTHTEEAEITEDGEEVVGFGLRKLLKTVPKETKGGQETTTIKPPPAPKKKFSLDFPPGLVHDESECIKSPKCWKEIRQILEKRPKRKRLKSK